ncbi:MAG TPA: VWA domain-containing protein [Solirubrobacterales bacterium]|nr:VWA domain-containing protein [Solirubrobacterales bacterium]
MPTPYGPKADPGPPGLAAKLLGFCEELRSEGVAIGTSEILDAFAALEQVPWTSQDDFREALASTIAKSQEDRRVFELLFERFFFRAAEAEAISREISEEDSRHEGGERLDIDELREQIREAILAGDDGQMRDLARLAIAAFGRRAEGSGVVGVDVQRIRRTLGLTAGSQQTQGEDHAAETPPIDRDQLNRFERHLRRELERDLIERTETLPPARPLAELDRTLPTNPTQDLAAVHRAVSQMKRRLATLGHEQRGRRQAQMVDVRRTMRASLQTGGVPLYLRYRPKRPRRPEIYVLCDVSTSVTSASVFFLSVLHALHDSFRKLRSFVFIERISEVTDVFEHERDFTTIAQRISSEGGVADVSGYTDYGRVWLEFITEISDDLDPRSTVIVLGDARTNGREPHAEVFAQVAERAGRLFWLNPEPKLYWNYGDSVMAAYERHCDGVFECWTTRHLENFVNIVAGGVPAAD